MSSSTNVSAQTNPDENAYFLYVGAYGPGVNVYRFNAQDGQLQSIGEAGKVLNPSFIIADKQHRFLYAVSEVMGDAQGGVASFAINRANGSLRALNTEPSGGVAPCHLALDQTGKMLIVANYTSGGVSSFPVEHDGRLGKMSALKTASGHSVNPKRQDGPHAHEVVVSSDNRLAYVPDLGLDEIREYKLDVPAANLLPNEPQFVKQDGGMGPRHMVFSHDEKFAYVVNELKSDVSVFTHDKSNGSMTKIQDASTLPAGYSGENGPAEILLDKAGKFVYASNRGDDSIAVFSVNGTDGKLTQTQVIKSGGKGPRGLALDPTGRFLFAGNQNSNNFVIFHVNEKTGQLAETGHVVNTAAPVAFLFVPVKQ